MELKTYYKEMFRFGGFSDQFSFIDEGVMITSKIILNNNLPKEHYWINLENGSKVCICNPIKTGVVILFSKYKVEEKLDLVSFSSDYKMNLWDMVLINKRVYVIIEIKNKKHTARPCWDDSETPKKVEYIIHLTKK